MSQPNNKYSSDEDTSMDGDKPLSMNSWCVKNGYDGVTKECVMSAFNSNNSSIQKLAKREKLKGLING